MIVSLRARADVTDWPFTQASWEAARSSMSGQLTRPPKMLEIDDWWRHMMCVYSSGSIRRR